MQCLESHMFSIYTRIHSKYPNVLTLYFGIAVLAGVPTTWSLGTGCSMCRVSVLSLSLHLGQLLGITSGMMSRCNSSPCSTPLDQCPCFGSCTVRPLMAVRDLSDILAVVHIINCNRNPRSCTSFAVFAVECAYWVCGSQQTFARKTQLHSWSLSHNICQCFYLCTHRLSTSHSSAIIAMSEARLDLCKLDNSVWSTKPVYMCVHFKIPKTDLFR